MVKKLVPGKRMIRTSAFGATHAERLAGQKARADLTVHRHQKLFRTIVRVQRHFGASTGRITVRIASVCADTGVTTIVSSVGKTTGPPADRLYAVDPVGVESTTPSAAYVAIGSPFAATRNRDDARESALVQHDVVERDPLLALDAAHVEHARLERHARLGDVVVPREAHQRVRELVGVAAGEKAEPCRD